VSLIVALRRPAPTVVRREVPCLYVNGKVDKGDCVVYWNLSHRRKAIRDLWLFIPALLLNWMIVSISHFPPRLASIELAIFAGFSVLSVSYHVFRWNRDERGQPRVPAAQMSAQVAVVPQAISAGWYPDPLGRHEYRYWDSSAWTRHVSDQGIVGADEFRRAVEGSA
jgi:hypothetical protein